MKIARFSSTGEDPRYGILDERDLVVLAGDPMYQGFETTGERVPLADAKLLAPVIPRSKVIGVGLNYAEHASEMDERSGDDPVVFLGENRDDVGDELRINPVYAGIAVFTAPDACRFNVASFGLGLGERIQRSTARSGTS